MAMKITTLNGRKDKAGKHNDRNFNLDNAPHIDQSRLSENRYWTYNGDSENTFTDIEHDFYAENFSDYLKKHNEKHEEHRNYGRKRTIEDYLHRTNTRPEDKILQIGDMREHASGEELWECALEYQRRFDRAYGDRCKILDMALHMDEATPHVHIRRVWIAEDEDGDKFVSQTKALEQMGISEMDEDRPIGRRNNSKITFSRTDRAIFETICLERGLDISKEKPERRKHLSTEEYKLQEVKKDIKKAEEELERVRENTKTSEKAIKDAEVLAHELFKEMVNDPVLINMFAEQLEEIKKKEKDKTQRLIKLIQLQRKYMEKVYKTDKLQEEVYKAKYSKGLREAEQFIRENGLEEKYLEQKDKDHGIKSRSSTKKK